jgi:hypothetical protein
MNVSFLYNLVVQNFWVTSIAWILLALVDNLLSVRELLLYRKGAHSHIILHDGSEINPFFAPHLGPEDYISVNTLIYICVGYFFLWLTWITKSLSGHFSTWEFSAGMALLIHLPIMIRHLRWTVFLNMARREIADGKAEGFWLEGKVKSAPCFFYRQHSLDMYLFAILWAFIFLVTGKVFFAGGALSAFMAATFYWLRR